MNWNELDNALANLPAGDRSASGALARALESTAREAARRTLTRAQKGGAGTESAWAVLSELGDLAIQPILAAPPAEASDEAFKLELAVEAHVAQRAALVAWFNRRFSDKRVVPPQTIDRSERRPLPRRVCDVAYSAYRTLIACDRSEDERILMVEAFHRLPEAEKDAEIRRVQESERFEKFLDFE